MGKRERELAALLSLSSWCLVIVVWLFLSVPWVCLQFVIVILTYYFWCHSCEQRWLWRVCTFAGSSLSLRHNSNSHVVTKMAIECHFCASSEGSGECAHLHRLT